MITEIKETKNQVNIPTKEPDRNYINHDKSKSEVKLPEDQTTQIQDKNINEAVNRINDTARSFNNNLRLEIDKDLGVTIVKVLDKETNKVIRQIPTEEVIALSKHLRDLRGLLIDKEV